MLKRLKLSMQENELLPKRAVMLAKEGGRDPLETSRPNTINIRPPESEEESLSPDEIEARKLTEDLEREKQAQKRHEEAETRRKKDAAERKNASRQADSLVKGYDSAAPAPELVAPSDTPQGEAEPEEPVSEVEEPAALTTEEVKTAAKAGKAAQELLEKYPENSEEEETGFRGFLESIRENFEDSDNPVSNLIVILLDEWLGYTAPEEFGGTQTKEDLEKLAISEKTTLEQLKKDKFINHKNNTVQEFTAAIVRGKEADRKSFGDNVEFDVRSNGGELVIRHNRDAAIPEVTFAEYVIIMKENPGWSGKMIIDLKDRGAFPLLVAQIKNMPKNFQKGLEVETFDPAIVMQVAAYNKDKDKDNKIPITFRFIALMKYANIRDASKAIKQIENNADWFGTAARLVSSDKSNNAFVGLEHVNMHTDWEEYLAAQDQDVDHILTFWNPLKQLLEKNSELIKAVQDSGGYFSFPYDATYLNWINSTDNKTGIDISRISVFNIDSYDGLYDAQKHGVGRMVHDVKDI